MEPDRGFRFPGDNGENSNERGVRQVTDGLRESPPNELDVDLAKNLRRAPKRSVEEARHACQSAYQGKQRKAAEESLTTAAGKTSALLRVGLLAEVGLADAWGDAVN